MQVFGRVMMMNQLRFEKSIIGGGYILFVHFLFGMILGACATDNVEAEKPVTFVQTEYVEFNYAKELYEAENARLAGNIEVAKQKLYDLFLIDSTHLEGHILLAMLKPNKKHWLKVEHIIILKGKINPFVLKTTLLAAAKHYIEKGNTQRSELFLEELFRRYPTSRSAALAQLAIAESAYRHRFWPEVIRACASIERIHSSKQASQRCKHMRLEAIRLMNVGPLPPQQTTQWTWGYPRPQGNDLNGLWLDDKEGVVIVGKRGMILEGKTVSDLSPVFTGLTRWHLNAVGGARKDALYAVGEGGIILERLAKNQWHILREPDAMQADLYAIYSPKKGLFFAVGEEGVVVEFRLGKVLVHKPVNVNLYGIWGNSPKKIIAVGDDGVAIRYDGKDWKKFSSDAYETLFSVHGNNETHMLLAGRGRTIAYFDGKVSKESVQGIHDFRSIWVKDKKHAWACGKAGVILRQNGGPLDEWKREATRVKLLLRSIYGTKRQVLAIGHGGTVLKRDKKRWKTIAGGSTESLVDVTYWNQFPIALGARGKLLYRNERKWKTIQLPLTNYRSLSVKGSDFIAAGSQGTLIKGQLSLQKGGNIKVRTTAMKLKRTFDLADILHCQDKTYVVGAKGFVVELEDGKIHEEHLPIGSDLHGIAGCKSPIAVGESGTLVIKNKSGWQVDRQDRRTDLNAVWVDEKEEHAVVVGDGGMILRRLGSKWLRQRAPLTQNLVAIWGRSPKDLFALSDRGNIIHFNGSKWILEQSPAQGLNAIAGNEKEVLAVGANLSILRREYQK